MTERAETARACGAMVGHLFRDGLANMSWERALGAPRTCARDPERAARGVYPLGEVVTVRPAFEPWPPSGVDTWER